MSNVTQSTRDLAGELTRYGLARKAVSRDSLTAYGAELATIASLMLADVSQAADIAQLAIAAHRSVKINSDPQSGVRPGDPLREAVPNALNRYPERLASVIVLADVVAGKELEVWPCADPVARVRALLRRWAMKEMSA